MMECILCKQGQTKPGLVTVTFQRDQCTVIIKDVPAEVCQNCGEYYLSDEISVQLLQRAEAAAQLGAEVEILRFVA